MLAPFALCLLLAATPAPAEDTLAEIGSYRLTREHFETMWSALNPGRRTSYEKAGGKSRLLQDIIDQKLVSLEAERRGYLARPAVAVAAEAARDAVLYRALVDEEVTRKVLADPALRAWYDQDPKRFSVPEMASIREIVVTPYKDTRPANLSGDDAQSDEQALAKIERLRQEIAGGADFAAVARRDSEDAAAADGGKVEPFARDKMSKAVEDAAFSLAPGKLSGVLKTTYGYHLILVENRTPAHVRTFEEARAEITQAYADEKKSAFPERLKTVTDEIRARTRVVIHDPALSPAPAPAPTP